MEEEKQKNYYELLGVPRDATRQQIKEAYRDIARAYHPDSNFFDEIIEEDNLSEEQTDIFKSLTAAYQTLIDEDSRERYDNTLPPVLRGWGEPSESCQLRESFHFHEIRKKQSPEATMANFGKIAQHNEFEGTQTEIPIQPIQQLMEKPNPLVELITRMTEAIDRIIDSIETALKKRRGFRN